MVYDGLLIGLCNFALYNLYKGYTAVWPVSRYRSLMRVDFRVKALSRKGNSLKDAKISKLLLKFFPLKLFNRK